MATYQEKEKKVRTILQKLKGGILSSLDPKNVLLTMISEQALEPEDVTEIECKIVKRDQVIALLDKLLYKPMTAFNIFMDALKKDRPDLFKEANGIALTNEYNYENEKDQSQENTASSLATTEKGLLVSQENTPCEASASAVSDTAQKTPTLHDYFAEDHFQAVISLLGVISLTRLFNVLKGLDHAKVSRLLQIVGRTSVHEDAKNVFIAWIEEKGEKATRQAIVDGLGARGLNLSKDNLKTEWAGTLGQKCVAKDIEAIIKKGRLAWDGLHKMFLAIGLEDFEIQNSRGPTEDVEAKSRKVFDCWIQTNPRPTIRDLLDALKSIDNLNAAQELAKMWGIPINDV